MHMYNTMYKCWIELKYKRTSNLSCSKLKQIIMSDTILVQKGGLNYIYYLYILVFKLFETILLKNYAVIVGVVKYDKNKNMHHIHNKCKKNCF